MGTIDRKSICKITVSIYIPTNYNYNSTFRSNTFKYLCIRTYIYIYIHSGAYDCLIGGYIDYGLSDLTGMVSEQVVLRESHLGYHETTGKLFFHIKITLFILFPNKSLLLTSKGTIAKSQLFNILETISLFH